MSAESSLMRRLTGAQLQQESFMNWLEASLPIWIIGAPFVYAIVDWMGMPKATTAMSGYTVDGRGIPRAA